MPSALVSDLRSPRLDGANGGEGRLPIPMGEGGTRGTPVGEVCAGREGKPTERGEP